MESPNSTRKRILDIAAQMRGIKSERNNGLGDNRITSLPDTIAHVLIESIGIDFNDPMDGLPSLNNDICPSCGNATLLFTDSCKNCSSCGHSEC